MIPIKLMRKQTQRHKGTCPRSQLVRGRAWNQAQSPGPVGLNHTLGQVKDWESSARVKCPGAEYLGSRTWTWSTWVCDAEERPVGEAVLTLESPAVESTF